MFSSTFIEDIIRVKNCPVLKVLIVKYRRQTGGSARMVYTQRTVGALRGLERGGSRCGRHVRRRMKAVGLWLRPDGFSVGRDPVCKDRRQENAEFSGPWWSWGVSIKQ